MNASRIFRVSVLQGGLTLRQHLNAYPGFVPEEAIRQLDNGPVASGRYDFKTAYELVSTHGWEIFPLAESRETALQSAISVLAKKLCPFWARMAILGREKVRTVLDPDQEQCLHDAHLLDVPIDKPAVAWWDNLAAFFRAQQQEQFNQIGRKAEELTIEYEQAQLIERGIPEHPVWIALEDNTCGYDVVSYRQLNGQIYPIYIEAKGSTATPVHFFLSRNEWEVSMRMGERYYIYAWNTKNGSLTIIPYGYLVNNTPVDNGDGRWIKAEFTT